MTDYSALFVNIAKLYDKRGRMDLAHTTPLDELAVVDMGDYKFKMNPHQAETHGVPPYHCLVEWKGGPCGLLSPYGGALFVGPSTSEDALIAAIDEELG